MPLMTGASGPYISSRSISVLELAARSASRSSCRRGTTIADTIRVLKGTIRPGKVLFDVAARFAVRPFYPLWSHLKRPLESPITRRRDLYLILGMSSGDREIPRAGANRCAPVVLAPPTPNFRRPEELSTWLGRTQIGIKMHTNLAETADTCFLCDSNRNP